MKIIFAGGGTAGHINPAIAIAQYIKNIESSAEILYVGAKGGMEENLVEKAGLNFVGIKISGFCRDISLKSLKKNIITTKRIMTSSYESRKVINQFKPDICVGTGGYVSGPILRVAPKMRVPIVIHEQNAFPGVTTKILSKYAKKIMIAMPEARNHIKSDVDIVNTGNPIRESILKADKKNSRDKLRLDNRPVILSFGGSLGSKAINEAVLDLILFDKQQKYQFIHAYGQYGKWFPELLLNKGVDINKQKNLNIFEYINNMETCLLAADLCICRAGAISISEIQAAAKPAILIPSPNVAENHQYHNAMALVNKNAASIIEEKNLSGDKLIEIVEGLIKNDSKISMYKKNLKKMAILDANQRIYSIIKSILDNQK